MGDSFPLYQMIVGDKTHWLPIEACGVLYDDGSRHVSIGGKALDESGLERDITNEERQRIADIADEHSANK